MLEVEKSRGNESPTFPLVSVAEAMTTKLLPGGSIRLVLHAVLAAPGEARLVGIVTTVFDQPDPSKNCPFDVLTTRSRTLVMPSLSIAAPLIVTGFWTVATMPGTAIETVGRFLSLLDDGPAADAGDATASIPAVRMTVETSAMTIRVGHIAEKRPAPSRGCVSLGAVVSGLVMAGPRCS